MGKNFFFFVIVFMALKFFVLDSISWWWLLPVLGWADALDRTVALREEVRQVSKNQEKFLRRLGEVHDELIKSGRKSDDLLKYGNDYFDSRFSRILSEISGRSCSDFD